MRYAAIMLLLVNVASAQVSPLKVVIKDCTNAIFCRTETGYGSAVAVASTSKGTVYATAGHNLKNSTGQGSIVSLEISGCPAKVVGGWVDTRATDFALVFVAGVRGTPIVLATVHPVDGEPCLIAGYIKGDRAEQVIHRIRGHVGVVRQGQFGQYASDIRGIVGMSGGPVVNAQNELIGIHVHEDGFCVNWPRNPERPTARGFKETVLTYFPDATFAEPARYVRNPETKADSSEVSQGEPKPEEVTETPKEEPKAAGGVLKAVAGGTKKAAKAAVEVVKVVAPVIEAVAPVAVETGWLALLGPYAAPVGLGLWAAREIVPRVAAWRRRKKAGEPVDGMAGYEHTEDGSVRPTSIPGHPGIMVQPDGTMRFERSEKKSDQEGIATASGLAKELATLVSRYEIQPNGKPEETFYRDAVAMVMRRHPDVDVLGGPEVGRNILKQVAKMHAAAAGDTLSGATR